MSVLMEVIGREVPVACAAGAFAAVAVHLVLAWDPDDRRRTLAIWGGWALRGSRSACSLLDGIARRIRERLGAQVPREGEVGLGEVSEMVDIVRLGLLAGLSFDAALGLYCEGSPGELSRRMERSLLSWQTGIEGRADALLAAARDLRVRELEAFAVAVSQAIELGAPLAETLEGQGRDMRRAHRADVERQIERAPVKLLIPVGTLILPALLLSILGPLLAAGGMI